MRDVVCEEKRSVEREEFVDFMKFLHEKVKLKLEQTNEKYKENVDNSKRHHVFEVCDEVLVHLMIGILAIGTYSKLKMRNFSPCKILRRFDNGNAYEVEFPNDMDISPMFNVSNLYEYHESDDEVNIPDDYPKK